jgi:hypothetical protein
MHYLCAGQYVATRLVATLRPFFGMNHGDNPYRANTWVTISVPSGPETIPIPMR